MLGDPDDLPDSALDARHLKLADAERDSNFRILLEGHLAALDPETRLEAIVYDIVDQVTAYPDDGVAPLHLWGQDFHSISSLRLYLGGIHWVIEGGRLVLSFDDRVGERLPGALIDRALDDSGLSHLIRSNARSAGGQTVSPVPATPADIVLPVFDLVTVNAELIAYLARHPELMFDLDPRKYEELVAEIFHDLGYDTVLTPRSRDGGRDIRAMRKDSVGTLMYLIECKRWARERPVGVEVVRSLYGVVSEEKATCGVIATTSRFTSGAHEFAGRVRYQMSLRDFESLRQWLINYRGHKPTD